jgi:hypothetical protein
LHSPPHTLEKEEQTNYFELIKEILEKHCDVFEFDNFFSKRIIDWIFKRDTLSYSYGPLFFNCYMAYLIKREKKDKSSVALDFLIEYVIVVTEKINELNSAEVIDDLFLRDSLFLAYQGFTAYANAMEQEFLKDKIISLEQVTTHTKKELFTIFCKIIEKIECLIKTTRIVGEFGLGLWLKMMNQAISIWGHNRIYLEKHDDTKSWSIIISKLRYCTSLKILSEYNSFFETFLNKKTCN